MSTGAATAGGAGRRGGAGADSGSPRKGHGPYEAQRQTRHGDLAAARPSSHIHGRLRRKGPEMQNTKKGKQIKEDVAACACLATLEHSL